MGLQDELPVARMSGGKCNVARVLESLDKGVRAELEELLAASQIQSQQIAGLAEAKGWAMRVDSIARHRRGDCKCR